MTVPHCRWCRHPVVRNLPCRCDRAQEEARRITFPDDAELGRRFLRDASPGWLR